MEAATKAASPPSAGARAAADIAALLRARNPLLWIVTKEEARAERLIMDAAAIAQYEPRFWDCATGITKYDGSAVDGGAQFTDPAQVLTKIRDTPRRALWVLRDMPAWLRDPTVNRAMRSLARALTMAPRDQARALIVLTPSADIPPELAGHTISIEFPLPDRAEIAAILDAAIEALPADIKAAAAPNGTRDAAIDAALGLTAEEAQACFAKSLVSTRRIDPLAIGAEKKRVITREKVLEWFDPLPGGLDAVGGLDRLKDWLKLRRLAFGAKARAYGLPSPKGVLMVGVPGCGKSLTAKAVSAAWQMPLLRLDLGAMRSKFVGESEGNIRKALSVAETIAPCVLWIDEIEKGMAGAIQGAADGGVSADALGTLLTWREERGANVFLVATANDITGISEKNPEFLRRFDETFFVDLPTLAERAEILRASLVTLGRPTEGIDYAAIADVTADFTGAEIARIVRTAMYTAFADDGRQINTADLAAAARATVPLARTAAEKVETLRRWANGRAQPASTTDSTTTPGAARALDI